jgi:hypothetical protein
VQTRSPINDDGDTETTHLQRLLPLLPLAKRPHYQHSTVLPSFFITYKQQLAMSLEVFVQSPDTFGQRRYDPEITVQALKVRFIVQLSNDCLSISCMRC